MNQLTIWIRQYSVQPAASSKATNTEAGVEICAVYAPRPHAPSAINGRQCDVPINVHLYEGELDEKPKQYCTPSSEVVACADWFDDGVRCAGSLSGPIRFRPRHDFAGDRWELGPDRKAQ